MAGGTYQIPVTLTSSGPLAAQLKFLDAIEHAGPRVALVSAAQLGTGSGSSASSIDPGASMTTKLTVFVTPLNQAAAQQLKSELETSPSS